MLCNRQLVVLTHEQLGVVRDVNRYGKIIVKQDFLNFPLIVMHASEKKIRYPVCTRVNVLQYRSLTNARWTAKFTIREAHKGGRT